MTGSPGLVPGFFSNQLHDARHYGREVPLPLALRVAGILRHATSANRTAPA